MNFKLSPYWICQLSGWGLATAYWVYWMIYNQFPSLIEGTFITILTLASSIGITHSYYILAKRKSWHLLSIRGLFPIAIVAIVVLALLFTIINISINYLGNNSCLDCGFWDMVEEARLRIFITGIRLMAIWVLAFHLYHYAQRGAKAETEKAVLENKAYEAQMEKLKAQLNPHFLFNSLNSVKAMIALDPAKARRAVVLLSDILRSSLHASQQSFIRLEEELQQVNDYVEIEKMRFEERLAIEVVIAPESLQAKVLPWCLQLLVENAIKHGINQRKAGGRLRIEAYCSAEELYLQVINDGQLTMKEGHQGLGLQNLKERLALHFGKRAHFEIKNLATEQVKATIKMPLEYA
ncbi:MAG: sensor histidine kinase [Saprospiraceae bacterium]